MKIQSKVQQKDYDFIVTLDSNLIRGKVKSDEESEP